MANGSATRVVIDFETAYKTPKTTGQAGISIPFNSCDLKKSRNLNNAETIRGDRNPIAPFVGNIDSSGNLVVPILSDAFGYLLKCLFGAPSTTGTGAPYTHAFKIDATDALPSFVLEKAYLDMATPYYELFTGCKANTLEVSVGGDGELIATIGILGATASGGETAYDASPTAASGVRFQHFHAAATEGGNAISILKEWKLSFSNNLDPDRFCIGGGGVRGDLPEGIASVSGSIQALFSNKTLLEKADGETESSMVIEFNPSADDNLKIMLPELVYGTNSPAISGPKGLLLDLNYSAFLGNDAGASAIAIELKNNVASYA